MKKLDTSEITAKRTTLKEREQRLMESSWFLNRKLFGDDCGIDINDFDGASYAFFLDNVPSVEALVEGLAELSPLADDALSIAEQMTLRDFAEFKLALARERRLRKIERGIEAAESKNQLLLPGFPPEITGGSMPDKYLALLCPASFVPAAMLAEKFEVPLGAAILRLSELHPRKKQE